MISCGNEKVKYSEMTYRLVVEITVLVPCVQAKMAFFKNRHSLSYKNCLAIRSPQIRFLVMEFTRIDDFWRNPLLRISNSTKHRKVCECFRRRTEHKDVCLPDVSYLENDRS